MAAAPSTLFSTLVADATKWDDPNFDYATVAATMDGTTGDTHAQVSLRMTNLCLRSPTCFAFILLGDEDHIHIGHSLTRFPSQPGADATPYDDRCTLLVGNDLRTCTPMTFENTTFSRTNEVALPSMDTVNGNTMHTAAPQVLREHFVNGSPGTDQLRARYITILPPGITQLALEHTPSGRYGLVAFKTAILNPELNHADAPRRAAIAPLATWFRAACTNRPDGHGLLSVTPASTVAPMHNQRLNAWATRIKDAHMARLGAGGPSVTTAAFNNGINVLRDSLTENVNSALAYDRDKSNKTFTQRHGEDLAQVLHNLCEVADDANLPSVHRLLAKASKHQDVAILQSQMDARIQAAGLPLSEHNKPLVTSKLLDQVFRRYEAKGSGLAFAEGLTPFAVVCQGHAEAAAVLTQRQKATLVESGGAVTLADADALTKTDLRFPTSARQAEEKLYGFSILVDIFHGVNHRISNAIRSYVRRVAPYMHTMANTTADNPAVTADLIGRVFFDLQQEYFGWLAEARNDAGHIVPSFQNQIKLITSYRASALPAMPTFWYGMFKEIQPSDEKKPTNTSPARAGSQSTVNSHADSGLLTRFKDSGFSSISAMTKDKDITIPKVSGNDVCLAWALKGQCTTTCKRKAAHTRYNTSTVKKIHEIMDTCGVAQAQP